MKKINILLVLILSTIFFAELNAQGNCDADFTASTTPNGTSFVGNMSNVLIPNLQFNWDFGDGNTSTDPFAFNSYANDGTYTVCCIVYIPSTCIDTSCQVITVTTNNNTFNCNAGFTYQADSIGNYSFNSTSSSYGSTTEFYNWTIDSFSISTTMANFNTYINQATSVCLQYTATDLLGNNCTAVYCEIVGSNYYPPDTTCAVNYTYNQDATGVTTFVANTSVAPNSYASILYNWSFDGVLLNNGSSIISQILPPSLVPITVCVEAIVTNFDGSVCVSNYCDTISTGNTGGNNNFCTSAFFYTQADSVTFNFNAIAGTSVTSYTWDFGDGSTSTMMNPTYTYTSTPDSIDVCLTTVSTDSSGYVCTDVSCLTIVNSNNVIINPSGIDSCNASFLTTFSLDTSNFITFQALQPDINGSNSYSWDFGNGSTGNGYFVNYSYNNFGTYNVCLTVSDSLLTCTETNCELVTYSNTFNPNANDVSGTIALAGDDFAIVYLVAFDAIDTSLTIIDAALSSYLTNGDYTFSNVADGDYIVKAALIPGSEFYLDYLPTYYGDVELWSNASNITVNGSSVNGVDINLIAGLNTGGPGIITGLIADGAGKVLSTPLAEAQVILYNDLNQPIAYTYADLDGNYTFENLPVGSYFVTVDVPGLEFIMFEVEITNNATTVNGVNLTAGESEPVGIVESLNLIETSIFPNPNNGVFTISLDYNFSNNAQLVIYNMIGSKVFESNITSTATNVYLSNQISKGIYNANVLDKGKVIGSSNFVVD